MKLSTREEIDSDPTEGSSGDGFEGTTVEVLGDEMTVEKAVEQLGEMLERPEAFGLVPASRLTELNERLVDVEAENGQLRAEMEEHEEWLEMAFRTLDAADSLSQFSLQEEGESES